MSRRLSAGVLRGRSGSVLDTPLGRAHEVASAPLVQAPEPDLSARYALPSPGEPVEPVSPVEAARRLAWAASELVLGRGEWRLLVWAESWPTEQRAALAGLLEAARLAGAAGRL